MGTTLGGLISKNQEQELGDFYLRQLRGASPMIRDPLLDRYTNQLAKKLLNHVNSLQTDFHFHWIRNDKINAFAFFGGNVVLHTGLFSLADNESELASVMAHEISHITQRHLMRSLESQQRSSHLTWIGAVGSVLLTLASPQAGMAALTGTLAGTHQGAIAFTQSNEQEADRIGIQLLRKAGFDPGAMANFLQKLSDKSRFSSTPPEILLTHPLTANRLSDTRNRTNQMSRVQLPPSIDYDMAKVRVLARYSVDKNALTEDLLRTWEKGNTHQKQAAQYGRVLRLVENKNFAGARDILLPLLKKDPENLWYLDLITDSYLGLNDPKQSIKWLLEAKNAKDDPVIQINLANAFLADNQPKEASAILRSYTWSYPDDINGWHLLAQASAKQGLRDEELSAQAEIEALTGDFERAIKALSEASAQSKNGSLKQARYDARIDQLRRLEQRFQQYTSR